MLTRLLHVAQYGLSPARLARLALGFGVDGRDGFARRQLRRRGHADSAEAPGIVETKGLDGSIDGAFVRHR